MSLIRFGFVLFFVLSALCDVSRGNIQKLEYEDENLLKPCDSQNLRCLRKTTQDFLDRTSMGIPVINIVPIDPMAIADIQVEVAPGKDVHLQEVAVVGLKHIVIKRFTMDTEARKVALGMEANVTVQGHISVNNKPKTPFNSRIVGLNTAYYDYELITNDKNVTYFKVGPETMDCETSGSPVMNIQEEVRKELLSGPDAPQLEEIGKKLACATFKVACGRVIANLRTIATIYSKESFFTDL